MTPEISNSIKENKKAFWEWKEAGKPNPDHPLSKTWKETKRYLRRTQIRYCYKEKSEENTKIRYCYKEKSEENTKIRYCYKEKSEENTKIRYCYKENKIIS
jgi:hypothetical protein